MSAPPENLAAITHSLNPVSSEGWLHRFASPVVRTMQYRSSGGEPMHAVEVVIVGVAVAVLAGAASVLVISLVPFAWKDEKTMRARPFRTR